MQTPNSITYKGKQLLKKALQWGKERYPDAPDAHHWAFAQGILELVRNEVDFSLPGPTCRSYAVSRASAGDGYAKKMLTNLGEMTAIFPDGRMPRPGQWEFDRACQLAEPICYGKLQKIHFDCHKTESCFDEAPEDLIELKKRCQ